MQNCIHKYVSQVEQRTLKNIFQLIAWILERYPIYSLQFVFEILLCIMKP